MSFFELIMDYLNRDSNRTASTAVIFGTALVTSLALSLMITIGPTKEVNLVTLLFGLLILTIITAKMASLVVEGELKIAIVAAIIAALIGIGIFEFAFPIIVLPLVALILMEIFWWTGKQEAAKGESELWFTIGKKLLYFAESLLLVFAMNGLYNLSKHIPPWIGEHQETIAGIISFIGWGTLAIAVALILGYIWIKINMLKLRRG